MEIYEYKGTVTEAGHIPARILGTTYRKMIRKGTAYWVTGVGVRDLVVVEGDRMYVVNGGSRKRIRPLATFRKTDKKLDIDGMVERWYRDC